MALSSSPNPKRSRKSKRARTESEPIPESTQPQPQQQLSQPSEAPLQPPRKRTKSPGVRVVGGRIYDSENGQTCHQCRQKTMDFVAACKNVVNGKPCKIKFCHKCLLNRYAEKAEVVDELEDWNCPKCRNICNCSFCRRKIGQPPTGILAYQAKASGFQSVSEMLTGGNKESEAEETTFSFNEKENTNQTNNSDNRKLLKIKLHKKPSVDPATVSIETHEDTEVTRNNSDNKKRHLIKIRRKTSVDPAAVSIETHEDGEVKNSDNKKRCLIKIRRKTSVDPTTNIQNNVGNDNAAEHSKHKVLPEADVPLPQGVDLTSVAGVELSSADVGPALQFSEFCNAFEGILKLKKGEAQSILQELTSGCKLPRRQYSSVIQFHEKLLSYIQKDMEEEYLIKGSSWFQALGRCISASQHALKEIPMECFDDGSGYEKLDTSTRLRLLNFFCDETLCTIELRNYINSENEKMKETRKESKDRVLAAKKKEKHLKKQMQDEIAKKIITNNGPPLSISEHEDVIAKIKTETAIAQQEKLAAISKVSKKKHRPSAVRTEPVLLTENGLIFWKLSGCSTEPVILLQDVGKFDSDEYEKWSTYDVEQRNEVENYISHQRSKMLQSMVVCDSRTDAIIKNESLDSPLPIESE